MKILKNNILSIFKISLISNIIIASFLFMKEFSILIYLLTSIFISVGFYLYLKEHVINKISNSFKLVSNAIIDIADNKLDLRYLKNNMIIENDFNVLITYLQIIDKQLLNAQKDIQSLYKGHITNIKLKQNKTELLGKELFTLKMRFKNILNISESLSKGKIDSIKIDSKDYNDEIYNSLDNLINIFKTTYHKNKKDIWLSQGLSNFSNSISEIKDIEHLTNKALLDISKYVKATSSSFYLYNNDLQELNISSTFSFNKRNKISTFKLGESNIGQVALNKEPILIDNINSINLLDNNEVKSKTIYTGTIDIIPSEIYTYPIIFEKQLLGVIEIYSLSKLTKIEKEYLIQSAYIIGVNLYSTIQNIKIQDLYNKSQITLHDLELAKKDIDKKADDLASSNKYKSEFLANMSHELRTPLNSIILLSSLLVKNKNENLSENDIIKAKVINESGSELLRLINDILDLSKIESNKMQLIVDEISSKELLEKYNEIFIHTAEEKNITFKVIDKVKDKFYNDKDRLGQVIKNLISNALKFTKEKGLIRLSISKINNEIVISVKDNGLGIPKEKQDLIFQAFTQVDGSTSREFGGTGLGLTITKDLIALMKGRLELESEFGKGSNFKIIIPSLKDIYFKKDENLDYDDEVLYSSSKENEKDTNNKEILSSNPIKQKDINLNKLKGKNILIVDDDMRNIFVLRATLLDYGVNIIFSKNGKECIETVKDNKKIDIILMDIMMPIMNGYEAITYLKNSEYKNIPIFAVSAKAMEEDKEKALNCGANGYITKPIDINILIKDIYKTL